MYVQISNARVGVIHTPHGTVDTPGFGPVATAGALKAIELTDIDKVIIHVCVCVCIYIYIYIYVYIYSH